MTNRKMGPTVEELICTMWLSAGLSHIVQRVPQDGGHFFCLSYFSCFSCFWFVFFLCLFVLVSALNAKGPALVVPLCTMWLSAGLSHTVHIVSSGVGPTVGEPIRTMWLSAGLSHIVHIGSSGWGAFFIYVSCFLVFHIFLVFSFLSPR